MNIQRIVGCTGVALQALCFAEVAVAADRTVDCRSLGSFSIKQSEADARFPYSYQQLKVDVPKNHMMAPKTDEKKLAVSTLYYNTAGPVATGTKLAGTPSATYDKTGVLTLEVFGINKKGSQVSYAKSALGDNINGTKPGAYPYINLGTYPNAATARVATYTAFLNKNLTMHHQVFVLGDYSRVPQTAALSLPLAGTYNSLRYIVSTSPGWRWRAYGPDGRQASQHDLKAACLGMFFYKD